MADISGHIKSGPVMELLTGSRCWALRLASIVIDSYCEDNERFHWILVAADNTWQIIKCQEREQVLYKHANYCVWIWRMPVSKLNVSSPQWKPEVKKCEWHLSQTRVFLEMAWVSPLMWVFEFFYHAHSTTVAGWVMRSNSEANTTANHHQHQPARQLLPQPWNVCLFSVVILWYMWFSSFKVPSPNCISKASFPQV